MVLARGDTEPVELPRRSRAELRAAEERLDLEHRPVARPSQPDRAVVVRASVETHEHPPGAVVGQHGDELGAQVTRRGRAVVGVVGRAHERRHGVERRRVRVDAEGRHPARAPGLVAVAEHPQRAPRVDDREADPCRAHPHRRVPAVRHRPAPPVAELDGQRAEVRATRPRAAPRRSDRLRRSRPRRPPARSARRRSVGRRQTAAYAAPRWTSGPTASPSWAA